VLCRLGLRAVMHVYCVRNYVASVRMNGSYVRIFVDNVACACMYLRTVMYGIINTHKVTYVGLVPTYGNVLVAVCVCVLPCMRYERLMMMIVACMYAYV
jgi:hypothetical protein